jgi:hypothetical protein
MKKEQLPPASVKNYLYCHRQSAETLCFMFLSSSPQRLSSALSLCDTPHHHGALTHHHQEIPPAVVPPPSTTDVTPITRGACPPLEHLVARSFHPSQRRRVEKGHRRRFHDDIVVVVLFLNGCKGAVARSSAPKGLIAPMPHRRLLLQPHRWLPSGGFDQVSPALIIDLDRPTLLPLFFVIILVCACSLSEVKFNLVCLKALRAVIDFAALVLG